MATNLEITTPCPSYRQPPDTYDEMCAGDGKVRAHWAYLYQALRELGPETLDHRRQDVRRLLRDAD